MARFLRKKSVPYTAECVLGRSILEHVPDFVERFFFLKTGTLRFWNAFFTVLFNDYFSLGNVGNGNKGNLLSYSNVFSSFFSICL
jgi:hypothetical protein